MSCSDDVVITGGSDGRVAGLARIGDLLRGHAELGYQHALIAIPSLISLPRRRSTQ